MYKLNVYYSVNTADERNYSYKSTILPSPSVSKMVKEEIGLI